MDMTGMRRGARNSRVWMCWEGEVEEDGRGRWLLSRG